MAEEGERVQRPAFAIFAYIGGEFMEPLRKIIHIDMDAFYASVEQRDHPELRGLPIAVGSGQPRGVVCAASYAARRYGVRSAMSCLRARELCASLVFVPPRLEVYKEVSLQIRSIFHQYTDVVEPLSLDEAFLDVTQNKPGIELAVEIARQIKSRIREELSLVASAGVSYNKFLAKVASDYRKPDGLCTIHPDRAQWFIDRLPVEDFWGVGRVTTRRMHALGIRTGKDLRECSRDFLLRNFGKQGGVYYDFARGVDLRPVQPARIRKSVGCEHTLEQDVDTPAALLIELYHVVLDLEGRIARSRMCFVRTDHKVSPGHKKTGTDRSVPVFAYFKAITAPLGFRYGDYADNRLVALLFLEGNHSVRFGEQGVVASHADVLSCVVFGASLAYDDVAGYGSLSGEDLHAQAFAFRITAVLGTTDTFLVCHLLSLFFLVRRIWFPALFLKPRCR